MAKKKKASQKGRKPFKRNVKTITKDLTNVVVATTNTIELIKEEPKIQEIVLEKGILNHNWVSKKYGVTIEEAQRLIIIANK